MIHSTKPLAFAAAAAVLTAGLATAQAAEKWDMPLAYAATNYHSENAAAFAKAVTEASGGELEIVTHPSGSLFKGGEIFRAVRTGQAPIGERLISALGNEDPIFEIDALPFLATSFEDARSSTKASKPAMEKVLEEQGRASCSTPCRGRRRGSMPRSRGQQRGGHGGRQVPRLQRRDLAACRIDGRCADQDRGGRAQPRPSPPASPSMISSGSTGYDRKIWEHCPVLVRRPGLAAQEHGHRQHGRLERP